jgi:hypothetical protein
MNSEQDERIGFRVDEKDRRERAFLFKTILHLGENNITLFEQERRISAKGRVVPVISELLNPTHHCYCKITQWFNLGLLFNETPRMMFN